MKVIVKKYLNVRVGKPSVNAPCYKFLAPGSELEVDGNYYKGDVYDDIDTWLRDLAGNYYWSGGVENPGNKIIVEISEKWWLKKYNLPLIWSMGLSGKDIRVTVLDTGIYYPHDDLNLDEGLFHDVTNSPTKTKDINGHGTHCIGIIKMSNNEIGSVGLAYNASIYVCKITHDNFGDLKEYMLAGILWAIDKGSDIISISNGSPFEYKDLQIEKSLQAAEDAGILVVAAAGNIIPGYPDNDLYYPAKYRSTLSVGGIDENNLPLIDSLKTNQINIYAPGKEILSTYKNNGFATLSGSSQAAPYVSGICALLLEHLRKKKNSFRAIDLKNIILNKATQTSFGKIINVQNLFS